MGWSYVLLDRCADAGPSLHTKQSSMQTLVENWKGGIYKCSCRALFRSAALLLMVLVDTWRILGD